MTYVEEITHGIRFACRREDGLRREHPKTWVEEILAECLTLRQTVLPESTLGQAVSYMLNQWPKRTDVSSIRR